MNAPVNIVQPDLRNMAENIIWHAQNTSKESATRYIVDLLSHMERVGFTRAENHYLESLDIAMYDGEVRDAD